MFRKMLSGNHYGRFTPLWGSVVGSRLCVAGIHGENKKTPVGDHYGRHGTMTDCLKLTPTLSSREQLLPKQKRFVSHDGHTSGARV